MAVGKKTGGRQKGTPNRATAAKVAEVQASGLTPLDYLLSIMRDEGAEEAKRIDAAKAAAPYIHPKRAPVNAEGQDASLTVIINKS